MRSTSSSASSCPTVTRSRRAGRTTPASTGPEAPPRCGLSPRAGPVRLQDDQPSSPGGDMKYAMLIFPKPGSHESLGDDEARALSAEYLARRDDPRCIGGAHLQPGEMATTVRHGDRENLITDGPLADAKEVLGGYYILEASDLDAALEFAQRIPAVRLGGAVEVRPLVEIAAEAAH